MTCAERDCERDAERRGMCFKHYMRWRRAGGIQREGRQRPAKREMRDGKLRCSDCAAWKPPDDFRRQSERRYGRAFVCNDCRNEAARASYNPTKEAERQRKRRRENPEKERLRSRRYYAENRDRELERKRRYQAGHLNGHRDKQARRRARKRQAEAEKVDPVAIWDRDKGICHICGLAADSDDWHLEHKVPLSRGGRHSADNVAVAHPTCNFKKGTKLPSEMV